ncbi:MAG TPA: glutaredoxin family protein [Gammaproteobacteria bacterium]|nr:glutaredoxin family protein [Gammaproteobacteria bacterium]
MREITLLGTVGCHLCEEAEALVMPVARRLGVEVRHVDIADDDTLTQRYATTIPVVRREDRDRELGWPFDTDSLYRFLL